MKVIRRIVKLPTITSVYAAQSLTNYGNIVSIVSDVLLDQEVSSLPYGDKVSTANKTQLELMCTDMNTAIIQSVDKILLKPLLFMKTLQHLISHMRLDSPLVWKTTSNMIHIWESLILEKEVRYKQYKTNYILHQSSVNINKIKSSITVNIIHSLDATLLKLLVMEIQRMNINLLSVHDSFIVSWEHTELMKDSSQALLLKMFEEPTPLYLLERLHTTIFEAPSLSTDPLGDFDYFLQRLNVVDQPLLLDKNKIWSMRI